jgi:hypothetical protein
MLMRYLRSRESNALWNRRIGTAIALETGCAPAGALLSASPSGPHVECVVGWADADARAAGLARDLPPVPLGTWRNREWVLAADVAPTVAARAAWIAIRSLAMAGCALAIARRDARERQALWPNDDPDDRWPGIFVSEQMQELVRIARRVAVTPLPVLLTGGISAEPHSSLGSDVNFREMGGREDGGRGERVRRSNTVDQKSPTVLAETIRCLSNAASYA